jgi:hypothetical protein
MGIIAPSRRDTLKSLIVAFAVAYLLLPSLAYAAPGRVRGLVRKLEFVAESCLWYSRGNAGFEGGDVGSWKLVYPLDGRMAEIRGHVRLPFSVYGRPAGIAMRVGYARSIRVKGTSTDTDWDEFGVREAYSESDSDADVYIWNVDAAFHTSVFDPWGFPVSLDAGGLVGYALWWIGYTNTNLHTTLFEYEPADYRTAGVNAYYDMEIRTGRLGVFRGHRGFRTG